MILKELAPYLSGKVRVMSGYNGKVLSYNYDPKHHGGIGDREVLKVWAEIKAYARSGFHNYAEPITMVYVSGEKEYLEDHPNAKEE